MANSWKRPNANGVMQRFIPGTHSHTTHLALQSPYCVQWHTMWRVPSRTAFIRMNNTWLIITLNLFWFFCSIFPTVCIDSARAPTAALTQSARPEEHDDEPWKHGCGKTKQDLILLQPGLDEVRSALVVHSLSISCEEPSYWTVPFSNLRPQLIDSWLFICLFHHSGSIIEP